MGKQKKILIFCFLCLFFVGALTPELAKGDSIKTEQLPQLIQVLTSNGAKIDSWSLYARQASTDLITEADVHKQADELMKTFKNYTWSEEKEQMDLRFVGETKDKDSHTSESITLLAYPQKNAFQTYLIYEVNGTKWKTSVWQKQLAPQVERQVLHLFGKKTQLFACASGEFDDKIDFVLSNKTDAILNSLHARKIEVDQEQTFSSVSAYTELWREQSIESNGRSIDLQLGLRKLKDRTTVTLGTPIITSEY